jgi:hypothetical protein
MAYTLTYIDCSVLPGMFTDEYTITIKTKNGNQSFFIDKQFVDSENLKVLVKQYSDFLILPTNNNELIYNEELC